MAYGKSSSKVQNMAKIGGSSKKLSLKTDMGAGMAGSIKKGAKSGPHKKV
jgi:hypothetical protein